MQCGRPGFNPWLGKIPWRRKRLPTPVFWLGEFHGLDHGIGLCSWVGPLPFTIYNSMDWTNLLENSIGLHSPWGRKESDTTKQLSLSLSRVTQWYKESACQCRRHRFNPWVGKSPWRKKWQPTLVFMPGKSHGQSSLADHSH